MASRNGHRPEWIDSLQPALAELERAVAWAIAEFTPGDFTTTPVTVTIQTRGRRPRCLGLFSPNGWSTREGENRHCIAISSEFLDREVPDIIGTVIHESVHLYNQSQGIRDTSSGGRHNRKFKAAAESFSLDVAEPSDSKGFAYTSISDDLRKRIDKGLKPDLAAFRLFAIAGMKTPKPVVKTVPWVCSPDGTCPTVRVATGLELHAQCESCGEDFTPK